MGRYGGRRGLRTGVAAVVAAVSVVVGTAGVPTPVGADHNVNFGHWPTYRWAGKTNPGVRGFWIFDRSGRSDVWSALNDVVTEWNTLPEVANSGGRMPVIAPYRDTSSAGTGSAGRCTSSGAIVPGGSPTWIVGADQYSIAFLCYEPANSAAGLTLQRTSADAHNTQYAPATALGPSAVASPAYLRTVLRHEIGHLLGLGHSADCGSLMAGPAYPGSPGAKCNPPAGRAWTGHDLAALRNFYTSHPVD